MVYFIVECTGIEEAQMETTPRELWKLYVDGSTMETASGAGVILITPTGYKYHSVLWFRFESSNNEAEYEALLARLRMAVKLKAKAIH